jgi:hypothetical protein
MSEETLTWRKARKSSGNGGNCVEVGASPVSPVVGLRDTKSRERGMLTVSRETFAAFLASVKHGELDQG